MKFPSIAGLMLIAFGLQGCMEAFNTSSAARFRAIFAGTPEQLAVTDEQALKRLSNKTMFTAAHGGYGQIVYLTGDGASYLWFPGNSVVLKGRWKLVKNKVTAGGTTVEYGAICFQYGPETYNPMTRQAGARWECTGVGRYIDQQTEIVDGDSFGLSKRKQAPFALPKNIGSMAEVRSRLAKGQ